jgi:hypothetical protein
MQNYSRIAREPDCFAHQQPRREHQARIERRGLVEPGVGIGPILRIVENEKAPTGLRTFNPEGGHDRFEPRSGNSVVNRMLEGIANLDEVRVRVSEVD